MRGNVLCVSSEFEISESWRRHLAAAGMHVVSASDPAEAFDCLGPERFDVLLLRDEIDVSDRGVLIREAARCRTPVLIVGCADRNCGADDYIATDAGAHSVVEAVQRMIERRLAVK